MNAFIFFPSLSLLLKSWNSFLFRIPVSWYWPSFSADRESFQWALLFWNLFNNVSETSISLYVCLGMMFFKSWFDAPFQLISSFVKSNEILSELLSEELAYLIKFKERFSLHQIHYDIDLRFYFLLHKCKRVLVSFILVS